MSMHKVSTHESVSQAIGLCVASNLTVLMWGPPGNGKSSVVKSIARDYNLHLETLIASIHDSSDFSGIPYPVDSKYVRMLPLEWAHKVLEEKGKQASPRTSIIFYDEISTAKPEVQAALLQPILERRVGHLSLPDATRSIGAANPADIAAGGWDLTPPLANRFIHVDWELDAHTVAQAFLNGKEFKTVPAPFLPRDTNRMIEARKYAISVVGMFIANNPDLLNNFDEATFGTASPFVAETYAFASPRAWETVGNIYASWLLARTPDMKPLPKSVLSILVRGTIGRTAGMTFLTFIDNLDLQDPYKILQGQELFKMPERADQKYTSLSGLEMAYGNLADVKTWTIYGDILAEYARNGDIDTAYKFVISWVKKRPEGAQISQQQFSALSPILSALKQS